MAVVVAYSTSKFLHVQYCFCWGCALAVEKVAIPAWWVRFSEVKSGGKAVYLFGEAKVGLLPARVQTTVFQGDVQRFFGWRWGVAQMAADALPVSCGNPVANPLAMLGIFSWGGGSG